MPEPDNIQLDLPATFKYLNVLGACLGEMLARAGEAGCDERTVYNIQLAVHEVCTNIVEHAYVGQAAGRIQISMTLHPAHFVVELHDTAQKTFKLPDNIDLDDVDLDNLTERSRGLMLIQQLMDHVEYRPQPGNNQWRLVKNLEN